jgi:tetratricopeptide (TPR) repeat protein
VARAESELGLAGGNTLSMSTLARLRENLNSDYIVVGSYLDLPNNDPPNGPEVRLDLTVQDARTANTIASSTQKGRQVQLDAMISAAGNELRNRLGVSAISTAGDESARAALPSNGDAARLYSEGLAKLRAFDALRARDLLEKAISADPEFALAHSALSSALSSLGYDSQARQEAKRAVELSSKLSEQERRPGGSLPDNYL